jgi:hypothetical protein
MCALERRATSNGLGGIGAGGVAAAEIPGRAELAEDDARAAPTAPDFGAEQPHAASARAGAARSNGIRDGISVPPLKTAETQRKFQRPECATHTAGGTATLRIKQTSVAMPV